MRADLYLVQNGYAESRTLASKLIADGAVTVDGRIIRKPAEDISEGEHAVTVESTADTRYVGRGGLKLEGAIAAFGPPVKGAIIADIGASTGGFTDCLLGTGAAFVFAVDAGHGQLHPRLLADPRVHSAEGCNARYLTPERLSALAAEHRAAHPDAPIPAGFDGRVAGCVMDVSFISQTLLHPALAGIIREGGFLISLIKPQFELDSRALGKRGVVKLEHDRRVAVDRVVASAATCGLRLISLMPSPIEGGDGNREFLAYFIRE